MIKNEQARGHLGAILSIVIWGTTFVSTKVLLASFTPVEILVIRMVIGALALCLAKPRRLRLREKNHHVYFFFAGLTGVALYFLMENIALTITTASNVGVIVSIAPLFTALLSRLVYRGDKLKANFFVGFALALGGISVISFAGQALSLNPTGDLLAVLAAACWAVYSLLIRKIGTMGYDNVLATRRVFLYGLLCLVPASLLLGFGPDVAALLQPKNLLNLLYLGLGASALCFATWNYAVRALGNVKTSAYIYAVPVITVVFSAIILGEAVTPVIVVGVVLTLAGLVVSEFNPAALRRHKERT